MSLRFDRKSQGAKKNNGFLVAIALCCAAVCLVAWSTAISGRSGGSADETDIPAAAWLTESEGAGDSGLDHEEDMEAAAATATPTTAAATAAATSAAAAAVTTAPTTRPAESKPASKISDIIAGGEVMKAFSGEELVFSVTMGDWRVHSGVDIKAADGAQVRSAMDGTVMEIMEDMLYGNTVAVSQSDSSILYYSGLSNIPMVSKGQKVKSGDVIGTIGTVPCEAADGPHLHLSMMAGGVFVDPVLKLGLK